jgi:hypothetical protein
MPDYFNETQYPGLPQKTTTNSLADITVGALADKRQTLVSAGGAKVRLLGNGTPTYASHHTVYVDGDVFILGNVMYNTNYSGGITTIPNFTLVVKGDIYVDNDVTQLDGLYIAQPRDDGSKGRIFTCASDTSGNSPVTDPAGLYTQCGANNNNTPPRQLTVNGAFLAQKVVLNRTGFSMRDSHFRECAFVAPPGCTNASKAAEIFNLSPEIYMSPPFFSPRSTATSGDFDYISSLPPVL